ncbi:MAG: creatininase family protein [Planctomycetes bacterium]|nr:creatininase family protein [Planctomycetota bacterium]
MSARPDYSSYVEYSKLRPKEVVARRTEMPIAYLGLGVLEWHGKHNPLGLDGEKAHLVLCELAKRLGGLVMPPIFWCDHRQSLAELSFNDEIEGNWFPEGLW